MIPYMVGKLAPDSSHLTRGLAKSVPGRGYFRAIPSQNRDKYVTSPIKHTQSGIRFFRTSSCNRRITNIISVVERFGRKPLCSSGRIPTRSQYSLRRRAMTFSSILPVCATSEMPLQLPHSVRSFFLRTMMMTYFHCCGTSPPLQIRTTISNSFQRRAGSPLRVILGSSTETPSGSTAFPFANERVASVSSCIVG